MVETIEPLKCCTIFPRMLPVDKVRRDRTFLQRLVDKKPFITQSRKKIGYDNQSMGYQALPESKYRSIDIVTGLYINAEKSPDFYTHDEIFDEFTHNRTDAPIPKVTVTEFHQETCTTASKEFSE